MGYRAAWETHAAWVAFGSDSAPSAFVDLVVQFLYKLAEECEELVNAQVYHSFWRVRGECATRSALHKWVMQITARRGCPYAGARQAVDREQQS